MALEFKTFLKELPVQAQEAPEAGLEELGSGELKALLESGGEAALYGDSAGQLYFSSAGRIFSLESDPASLRTLLSDIRLRNGG
jgi:hypothetical protein